MDRLLRCFSLTVLLLAGAGAESQQASTAIDSSKLVDLTYAFDENTVYWPNAQPFHWEKSSWGKTAGGYFYAAGRYAASEHGGTHLDAPIHFAEGKQTIDDVPLHRLVAPAVVIDISQACDGDADNLLKPQDVTNFEKTNGRIAPGTIVLVRTGWGRFWPDKKRYLGSNVPGDTANLHFPGIGRPAAELLASRKIAAVGIDTASMDHGPSKDFIAHRIFSEANIYGLENVANLDKVPVRGATIIALPMKINGGSGGPVRILALLP